MSQKFPNLAAHKQTNLNLRTQGAAGYIPVDPFKPSIAFSLNNFPSWFLKGRVRNNEDESEQHSIKVDDPENGNVSVPASIPAVQDSNGWRSRIYSSFSRDASSTRKPSAFYVEHASIDVESLEKRQGRTFTPHIFEYTSSSGVEGSLDSINIDIQPPSTAGGSETDEEGILPSSYLSSDKSDDLLYYGHAQPFRFSGLSLPSIEADSSRPTGFALFNTRVSPMSAERMATIADDEVNQYADNGDANFPDVPSGYLASSTVTGFPYDSFRKNESKPTSPQSTRESPPTWSLVAAFILDTIPRQIYLYTLLCLPYLYYSRVARIFEEADMSLPMIQQGIVDAAKENMSTLDPGSKESQTHKNTWQHSLHLEPLRENIAYMRLQDTWQTFIDSLLREWKTLNIISVLLLSAILTFLQIDTAASDPLTRYAALLSMISALMSLLYGCIYIIRFGTMRKTYKGAEWAEEAQKLRTRIFWNIWVLLAMPATWLTWSMIFFIVTVMSFVWRTSPFPTDNDTAPSISADHILAAKTIISCVLAIGMIYLGLITATLKRYGEMMDRAWQNRIRKWIIDGGVHKNSIPNKKEASGMNHDAAKPPSVANTSANNTSDPAPISTALPDRQAPPTPPIGLRTTSFSEDSTQHRDLSQIPVRIVPNFMPANAIWIPDHRLSEDDILRRLDRGSQVPTDVSFAREAAVNVSGGTSSINEADIKAYTEHTPRLSKGKGKEQDLHDANPNRTSDGEWNGLSRSSSPDLDMHNFVQDERNSSGIVEVESVKIFRLLTEEPFLHSSPLDANLDKSVANMPEIFGNEEILASLEILRKALYDAMSSTVVPSLSKEELEDSSTNILSDIIHDFNQRFRSKELDGRFSLRREYDADNPELISFGIYYLTGSQHHDSPLTEHNVDISNGHNAAS